MEQDLHVRDRVGVQDFVLLENHTSEAEFLENLQKRFKEDLIYVRFLLLPDFALLLTSIKWNLRTDLHRIGSGFGQSIQEPPHLRAGLCRKISKC